MFMSFSVSCFILKSQLSPCSMCFVLLPLWCHYVPLCQLFPHFPLCLHSVFVGLSVLLSRCHVRPRYFMIQLRPCSRSMFLFFPRFLHAPALNRVHVFRCSCRSLVSSSLGFSLVFVPVHFTAGLASSGPRGPVSLRFWMSSWVCTPESND